MDQDFNQIQDNSNLIRVIRAVRPCSSVGQCIVLKTRGSSVRTFVWPKFFVNLIIVI